MTATSAAPTPGAALPAATVQVDIISIQSQVVYGCVGNNAAMPVFRKAGWRALAVPTVILSNTPHYPTLHGGPCPWIGSTACCRVWKTGRDARGAGRGSGYLGQLQARTRWRAGCRRCAPPGPTSRCISIRSWATATTGCT